MRVTYVKQIREDVLLLVAEDVPVRMVPVRHLHAVAVPSLGLEGIIDREAHNIPVHGAYRYAEFCGERRLRFTAPGNQNAHDFRPAFVAVPHGRPPPFQWP